MRAGILAGSWRSEGCPAIRGLAGFLDLSSSDFAGHSGGRNKVESKSGASALGSGGCWSLSLRASVRVSRPRFQSHRVVNPGIGGRRYVDREPGNPRTVEQIRRNGRLKHTNGCGLRKRRRRYRRENDRHASESGTAFERANRVAVMALPPLDRANRPVLENRGYSPENRGVCSGELRSRNISEFNEIGPVLQSIHSVQQDPGPQRRRLSMRRRAPVTMAQPASLMRGV